ncbi:hypothetical protein K469DRAFT_707849 [Zopfia rhizophila CBS 207.26]|uniref:Uncharacterized protein n=1 Tax=Zopfia rhizophila CBS 207.26 TaxID=1314779 RepID=A0A6A6E0Z6_9PEZI|nr:hypothetical protein K469DRAFT_707849 [Zopfia rhizophila CBS 207.26]
MAQRGHNSSHHHQQGDGAICQSLQQLDRRRGATRSVPTLLVMATEKQNSFPLLQPTSDNKPQTKADDLV